MITRPQNPSLRELLFTVRGSIVQAIWPKLLYVVLLSLAVTLSHGVFLRFDFGLTTTPLTLWGLTLAIFLGFRNTTAYQRFWEARGLWGELLIAGRNLARQVETLLPGLSPTERRHLLTPLLAFGYALRDHLRREAPSADLQRVLAGEDALLAAPHWPSALIRRLGTRLVARAREEGLGDPLIANLDQQLDRLTAVLSGCERIRQTPIPYPYILMLHRVVHVYCFLLPFCLVDSLGWFTPLAVLVLAYTFFGLDALGDQIADPFGTQPNHLPLDALSRGLEIAVLDLLGEPTPEPIRAEAGLLR